MASEDEFNSFRGQLTDEIQDEIERLRTVVMALVRMSMVVLATMETFMTVMMAGGGFHDDSDCESDDENGDVKYGCNSADDDDGDGDSEGDDGTNDNDGTDIQLFWWEHSEVHCLLNAFLTAEGAEKTKTTA